MKLILGWVLAGVLFASTGFVRAEETEDAATTAAIVDDECEDPGYRHDHRQQKGLPSGKPDCKAQASDTTEDPDAPRGHDHREQHKHQ